MVKVAPAGPGHRAAPKLPGKAGGGGKEGGGGAASAKVLRQTEELQHLLRLRAEELVARDNDLAACGEQIVKLEGQNAELQEENHALAADLQTLTRQLEMLQTQYTDLSEKHGALRAEHGLQRAELEEKKKLINATPGLKPTPPAAKEAIKRAAEALEAPAPSSGGDDGGSSARVAPVAHWPGHSPEERTVWNSLQWLGTTAVTQLISKAILAPLEGMPKGQRPRELAFVRGFAGSDGPAALLELLSQGSLRLLYELRDELHGAIKKLAERAPSKPDEVSGKYVEVLDETIGALQEGGVTTFDERIEEIIGPPHSRWVLHDRPARSTQACTHAAAHTLRTRRAAAHASEALPPPKPWHACTMPSSVPAHVTSPLTPPECHPKS